MAATARGGRVSWEAIGVCKRGGIVRASRSDLIELILNVPTSHPDPTSNGSRSVIPLSAVPLFLRRSITSQRGAKKSFCQHRVVLPKGRRRSHKVRIENDFQRQR